MISRGEAVLVGHWAGAASVRPSRLPLRAFLRMRAVFNAIENLPHPESLTRNDWFAFKHLRGGGRAVEGWPAGPRLWRWRWSPRSPWRGGGYGRTRRRYARPPIAGAGVGTL